MNSGSLRRAGTLVTLACFVAFSTRLLADTEVHKASPEASIVRGSIVFGTYCVLCHGASAQGDGRAARMYSPRPANLTSSPNSNDYWELMIRRGGAGVGRSPYMPPWGEQLTDEQVKDLIAYVRSLNRRTQ